MDISKESDKSSLVGGHAVMETAKVDLQTQKYFVLMQIAEVAMVTLRQCKDETLLSRSKEIAAESLSRIESAFKFIGENPVGAANGDS